MDTVARKLEFNFKTYEYSHSKDNILIYISQPEHYYDDWEEDGGLIVVRYRPSKNEKDRYVVLHQLRVNYCNGHIEHINISNLDKIPKIVE